VTECRLLEPRAQDEVPAPVIHEWVLPDGRTWARFHKVAAGYLVRFPGLADFEIAAADLRVSCLPAPSVTQETCRHLFLNQVLPLVMSRQGHLVFHASAVEIAGAAMAFVGGSGSGKSTLAASFATGGGRFLGDDGLVVEQADKGFRVLPGHPSIRLWQDSRDALIGAGTDTAPAVQHTSKARFLAGPALAHCSRPLMLAAAYFLGDGSARRMTIERMSASEALVEWVRNSFLLDPRDGGILARHFDRVAALANSAPCYRLDYPRRYRALPGIRDAIAARHRSSTPVHEAF
jgi:hypothetical protein